VETRDNLQTIRALEQEIRERKEQIRQLVRDWQGMVPEPSAPEIVDTLKYVEQELGGYIGELFYEAARCAASQFVRNAWPQIGGLVNTPPWDKYKEMMEEKLTGTKRQLLQAIAQVLSQEIADD